MRQFISKNNFIVSICVVILILVFSCYTFVGCANNQTNEKYPLTEKDLEALKNNREFSIDEDFKDDYIYVHFKDAFKGEIGFDFFSNIDGTEIIHIEKNYYTYIDKGDTEKLYVGDLNCNYLRITLSTHSKQIVLSVIKQINKKDEVLLSTPIFNYDTEPDYAPDDLENE